MGHTLHNVWLSLSYAALLPLHLQKRSNSQEYGKEVVLGRECNYLMNVNMKFKENESCMQQFESMTASKHYHRSQGRWHDKIISNKRKL